MSRQPVPPSSCLLSLWIADSFDRLSPVVEPLVLCCAMLLDGVLSRAVLVFVRLSPEGESLSRILVSLAPCYIVLSRFSVYHSSSALKFFLDSVFVLSFRCCLDPFPLPLSNLSPLAAWYELYLRMKLKYFSLF